MRKPESQPWDRLPGESSDAHRAFVAFRDLGPTRKLLEAYRQTKGKPAATQADGTWNGWCSRFSWLDRAAVWDDLIQRGRDRVAASRAAEWERRRLKALEDGYRLALKVRDRAEAMLDWPLERRVLAEDGRTIHVHPARFTMATALEAVRVATDLECRVLEATTVDLEKCSRAELEAIVAAAHEPLDDRDEDSA